MKEQDQSYWIVIPALLFDDESLAFSDRCLYGFISSLVRKVGYCWASNETLADMMGVSKIHVSRMLKKLQVAEYVRVEYEASKTGTKRRIYLENRGIERLQKSAETRLTSELTGSDPLNREVKPPLSSELTPLNREVNQYIKRIEKEDNKETHNTTRERKKIERTSSGAVDVNVLKSKIQREEIPQVAPIPLTEPEITPEMYIVTRVDPGPNSERMQVWKMKTGASYETIVAEIQVFASKHLARDYADVAEEKVLGLLQAGNEQRFRRVFESSFLSRIKPNPNNEYRTSSKNGNHTRKKTESEKWDAIFDEIKSGTFGENQPSTEVGYL